MTNEYYRYYRYLSVKVDTAYFYCDITSLATLFACCKLNQERLQPCLVTMVISQHINDATKD